MDTRLTIFAIALLQLEQVYVLLTCVFLYASAYIHWCIELTLACSNASASFRRLHQRVCINCIVLFAFVDGILHKKSVRNVL